MSLTDLHSVGLYLYIVTGVGNEMTETLRVNAFLIPTPVIKSHSKNIYTIAPGIGIRNALLPKELPLFRFLSLALNYIHASR